MSKSNQIKPYLHKSLPYHAIMPDKFTKVLMKPMGPVFGYTKPLDRTKAAEKLKKLRTNC